MRPVGSPLTPPRVELLVFAVFLFLVVERGAMERCIELCGRGSREPTVRDLLGLLSDLGDPRARQRSLAQSYSPARRSSSEAEMPSAAVTLSSVSRVRLNSPRSIAPM